MKLEQICENGRLDFNSKSEWVSIMKRDGVTEFFKEEEKGFPDFLIYAVKDGDRLVGTWNEKKGTGIRYSTKEGKKPGMMFDKGYRKTKRNLKKVKV